MPSSVRGPNSSMSSVGERQLVRRRSEVGPEHVGVVGVEDGRLHGSPEQRLRMVHEECVERLVAGHQHAERLLAGPAGAAELLLQRGPGAGEPDADDGVQTGHVDAELERVGAREAEQVAVTQSLLELAPLLGEVAAAVGGDGAHE